jgi:hypothetical protein
MNNKKTIDELRRNFIAAVLGVVALGAMIYIGLR